jgi:hypothetical protein
MTRFKIMAAALAVSLMAGVGCAAAASQFTDVPDNKYYTEAVEWAADIGITTGTSATTFSPDRPATRGEVVTFLKRYHDNVVLPALNMCADQG